MLGWNERLAWLPTSLGIGSSSDELSPGLRRMRFQSHYVFFIDAGDYVAIRAVIHVRQNLRPELFE